MYGKAKMSVLPNSTKVLVPRFKFKFSKLENTVYIHYLINACADEWSDKDN